MTNTTQQLTKHGDPALAGPCDIAEAVKCIAIALQGAAAKPHNQGYVRIAKQVANYLLELHGQADELRLPCKQELEQAKQALHEAMDEARSSRDNLAGLRLDIAMAREHIEAILKQFYTDTQRHTPEWLLAVGYSDEAGAFVDPIPFPGDRA